MLTHLLTVPVLVIALTSAASGAGELETAQKLYSRTQYRPAIDALKSAAGSGDAAALALTGKAWYMLSEFKRASEALEKAVAAEPHNSGYHHWLGKAYGRRAETSSPFTAPFLAGKARESFEKAVELDSSNAEAVNDLFSYYLEAPGFLGGGLDKAEALAARIRKLDEAEYHYAMAQLAQKRKEFRSAEHHFRSAFRLAPKSVGRAIDLARFLASQGKEQESETVLSQAEKIDPKSPRLMFERASFYVRGNRNLKEARELLQRYLSSSLTPDDPPRREAEKLLKQAAASGA